MRRYFRPGVTTGRSKTGWIRRMGESFGARASVG